ncbi:type II toxin-antitoxin system RelE/ParE family toxin [Nitrosomonas sp. JL21]|uniref:type II toxin-antitoxin system RelE/ParE family toxin n=1 Tax=Nitrosomonas sp. JL21 TaxID=153949 RepID=UPI00136F3DFE|nr:type II toxin-antitoxin system RelE/ParE family toxin [Nitrosomonas sp. JL21]MXS77957.1 type II toxin-antitoxin system RelE/ParE family toxin [Nitrosomonas sp. JL21]
MASRFGRLIRNENKQPYRVEWRQKAREDLSAIVRYIGKENPPKAQSFGQELRDKTLSLTHHPELGRTGRPGLPDYMRELVVHRNYIVLYRVLDESRTVEVLRVKHTAQQMP